jgi:DNA polymerase III alpha subunit
MVHGDVCPPRHRLLNIVYGSILATGNGHYDEKSYARRDQPLMALFRHLLPDNLVRSVDLPRHKGRRIRTAGIAVTGRSVQTTEGREMQFITLEDEWGLMELTVFPRMHEQMQYLMLGPYLVVGTIQKQYGVFGVTVEIITLVPSEGIGEE